MLDLIWSDESLYAFLALLTAFAIGAATTPLAGALAKRCDCMDKPDGKRKLHPEPVPYFGGLAILAGFVISLLLFHVLMFENIPRAAWVMAVGGMAICFVGVIDDMFDMKPLLKLFWQIAIAAFAAIFGGAIEYVTVFGITIVFGVFSVPVTVLWMVLIINAVNLIDGLDGLAGGVTALEAFALLMTAMIMGNPICMIAAGALCGAALGFLPYNANRATIFMGDAGAMFIGYILACISVFGLFKVQALFSVIVPALIFALPILDTVLAFFRRIFKGQSPFCADHSHLHHRLMASGFSPRQAVLLIYFVVAVFCVASILFMKYKLLSACMVVCDLAFLEVLKNKKKLATLRQKRSKKDSV